MAIPDPMVRAFRVSPRSTHPAGDVDHERLSCEGDHARGDVDAYRLGDGRSSIAAGVERDHLAVRIDARDAPREGAAGSGDVLAGVGVVAVHGDEDPRDGGVGGGAGLLSVQCGGGDGRVDGRLTVNAAGVEKLRSWCGPPTSRMPLQSRLAYYRRIFT